MIPLPTLAAVKTFAVGFAIAAAAHGGWVVRGWKEDAARLEAERAAHATYVATTDGWAAAMNEIGRQRAEDQQQAADDRRAFERRLRHATRPGSESLVVCGPGLDQNGMATAGGIVRFAPAFTGLWNDALAIGLPAALRAGRSDGPGAAADPARTD